MRSHMTGNMEVIPGTDGKKRDPRWPVFWDAWHLLERLGLVDFVGHLLEADNHTADIIHPYACLRAAPPPSQRLRSWLSCRVQSKSWAPIFLVLGLSTRFAALVLLVMTCVVELTVPDGWPVHITWAAMALGIMVWGPGRLSADHRRTTVLLPTRSFHGVLIHLPVITLSG